MNKHKLPKKNRLKNPPDEKNQRTIGENAHFRQLNRDADHGLEAEDWLEAEREVMRNVYDRDPED